MYLELSEENRKPVVHNKGKLIMQVKIFERKRDLR